LFGFSFNYQGSHAVEHTEIPIARRLDADYERNKERANGWISQTMPQGLTFESEKAMWMQLTRERRTRLYDRDKILRNMRPLPFNKWCAERSWKRKVLNAELQRHKSEEAAELNTTIDPVSTFGELFRQNQLSRKKSRARTFKSQNSEVGRQVSAIADNSPRRGFLHRMKTDATSDATSDGTGSPTSPLRTRPQSEESKRCMKDVLKIAAAGHLAGITVGRPRPLRGVPHEQQRRRQQVAGPASRHQHTPDEEASD